MNWALLLGSIGANLIGGLFGANAANNAADAQTEAAQQAIGLQAGALQQARIDAYPWALSGAQALYKYMDELGIPRPQTPILPDVTQGPLAAAGMDVIPGQEQDEGGWPWQQGGDEGGGFTLPEGWEEQWSGGLQSPEDIPMTESLGFRETPGYQFQQQEGQNAIMQNMNALGLRQSGAALKALTNYSQGVADQTYGSYLNRLGAISGVGQTQTAQTNALTGQYAQNIGNTLQDAGAARASGYVGGANAWLGALGNTANSLGYAYGLNQVYG